MPRRKKTIHKGNKKPTGTKNPKHSKLGQHGQLKCCTPNPPKEQPDKKPDNCDKGDGKVRKSPLKFVRHLEISTMKKNIQYKGVNRSVGLSPKEKSFIICKCQAQTYRYKLLKKKAEQAIHDQKIFTIFGACNGIRTALLERGWIEKLSAEKMNLSRIRNGTCKTKHEINGELEKLLLSYLVDKHQPNFIWYPKDEHRVTIDMAKAFPPIVNKLNSDTLWTTKQGLCSAMKRNYWFYIEDVAEVLGPRSYNNSDFGEIEGFVNDYQITACTSLLKWVLSMVANDRPVFVDEGKVSVNVVLFALCRCKEYLYKKENRDIDRVICNTSNDQWNKFLSKYYRIIGKDDVFQKDTENKLPLYMAYAKFLLKRMHVFRPQLSCEGCHNIWIIKPAHNSRGRGIRMASKLAIIHGLLNKVNDKYVVQKYIEEPLLIHETKFDIRQYCLVTSTYPLVIWMYQDCYLKFSSQKYNLKNYHESIHLTNNAVQRKYNNCAGRHRELPPANMWDCEKYKEYLRKIDKSRVWDKIIYPGMKKSIIGIMLSCQDTLTVCKNRFELYGCDFILDKEYKPWLIEINSNPDLNPTTPVTAKICPSVLSDVIKVVIDYANDPSSSTGKFECIYQQPMTIPRYGGASELYIRGLTLPNDYFYKGNIDMKGYFDYDVDIKDYLDKIKHTYDADTVMRDPEDDNNVYHKTEQATGTCESDDEISIAASVVTAQLDELIDRIGSEHNLDGPESPDSVKFDLTPTPSVTDIKAMFDKSLNNISKEMFYFSELDDGPLGKGSFVGVHSPKKIINDIKQLKEFKILEGFSKDSNSLTTDFMLEATTKLIDFINKKEQEYSHKHP